MLVLKYFEQCFCCYGGTLVRSRDSFNPFSAVVTNGKYVAVAQERHWTDRPNEIYSKAVPRRFYGNRMEFGPDDCQFSIDPLANITLRNLVGECIVIGYIYSSVHGLSHKENKNKAGGQNIISFQLRLLNDKWITRYFSLCLQGKMETFANDGVIMPSEISETCMVTLTNCFLTTSFESWQYPSKTISLLFWPESYGILEDQKLGLQGRPAQFLTALPC